MKAKDLYAGKGFYIVLALCVLVSGFGAVRALRSQVQTTIEETESSTTYDWENQTEVITEKANVEATNVPDDRVTTTAENFETTTQRTDNLPYEGDFALPLGTDILKDYSHGEMVKSKTLDDWRLHNGIDFSGKKGDEIKAIHDGLVLSVEADDLWGSVITIDHGKGMVARYCGVTPTDAIKKDSIVTKSDVIGTLSEIPVESADGLHLHLEITIGDVIDDPLKVMNKDGE